MRGVPGAEGLAQTLSGRVVRENYRIWFWTILLRPCLHQKSVTLVTTDINGCSDTLSQDVEVFATRPEITVDKTVICFPTEVNFTNLTTSDTTIVSWEWDFGDGNTSSDQHPTHIYNSTSSSGDSIIAQLVTTDILGCQYNTLGHLCL